MTPLVWLFGGYGVYHSRLGVMWFLTERAAWRHIQGRGLSAIDPYRAALPRNARPVYRPGRISRPPNHGGQRWTP